MATEQNYGAVFTRPWVVELMLETCGYTPNRDLATMPATEPACGDGAFLLPMVRRLSTSLRNHGRTLAEAKDTLRAFDLQPQHVKTCRTLVTECLVAESWNRTEASRTARGWISQGDYLLTDHPPTAAFVIGNPPYLRSDDLLPEQRSRYLDRCRTMTVGSDIFVGFIETGLRSLRPDGTLAFIVADRWMHNNYGRKLRQFVLDGYAVQAIYELHGVNAFAEEVSAYPAITQIRRGTQGPVRYATARPDFDPAAADRLLAWSRKTKSHRRHDHTFSAAVLPGWFDTDSMWPSASPERLELLESLNERLRPLEDAATGTRIGIGIATGADKAFIVHERNGIEPDRLLALATTAQLRSGTLRWQDTWLANPWHDDGTLIALDAYPGLRAHLEPKKALLRSRHIAKASNSEAWHRTIDKVKPQLAAHPKLLFQDMKATIQPVLDTGGHYPHHNLYWLTSEAWDLRVLGGLLLSRVAEMFVAAYGVKMRGGTMRFQAQYLRLIRVPAPDSIAEETRRRLVDAFEMRDAEAATAAALEAYGLESLPD